MSEIHAHVTAGTVEVADLKDLATQLQALSTDRVTYLTTARRQGGKQFPLIRVRPKRVGNRTHLLKGSKRGVACKLVPWSSWESIRYAWDIVNVHIASHPLTQVIAGVCLKKIYDVVLVWARRRKSKTGNAVRVSIYGPQGTPYKTIEVGRPKEIRSVRIGRA